MYIFGFLVFILVVVGLFCQYHSQVITLLWYWLERLVPEMTYYVSSGMLNSIYSLTFMVIDVVIRSLIKQAVLSF